MQPTIIISLHSLYNFNAWREIASFHISLKTKIKDDKFFFLFLSSWIPFLGIYLQEILPTVDMVSKLE